MMGKLGLSIAGVGLLAMGCGAEYQDYSSDRLADRATTEDEAPEFNFDRNNDDSAASDIADAPDAEGVDRNNGPTSVVVRDGSLFTTTGGFDVQGRADDISSSGNTKYLNTYLTRTDDSSAMAIIDIENLIDPAFIENGRTTVFRNGRMVDRPDVDESGPSLTMVVCAGPQEGEWEVDQVVPEVDVTVEENSEGERVLIFESELMDAELVLDIQG